MMLSEDDKNKKSISHLDDDEIFINLFQLSRPRMCSRDEKLSIFFRRY